MFLASVRLDPIACPSRIASLCERDTRDTRDKLLITETFFRFETGFDRRVTTSLCYQKMYHTETVEATITIWLEGFL